MRIVPIAPRVARDERAPVIGELNPCRSDSTGRDPGRLRRERANRAAVAYTSKRARAWRQPEPLRDVEQPEIRDDLFLLPAPRRPVQFLTARPSRPSSKPAAVSAASSSTSAPAATVARASAPTRVDGREIAGAVARRARATSDRPKAGPITATACADPAHAVEPVRMRR